jgi:hypothetical protein
VKSDVLDVGLIMKVEKLAVICFKVQSSFIPKGNGGKNVKL